MNRPCLLALALLVLGACTCGGADAGHECVPCRHGCVDLLTDAANCGACDAACGDGLVCEAARCVEPCPPGPRFVWPYRRSPGVATGWAALADLTGDGRADLVAPGPWGGIAVYPGASGAVFADGLEWSEAPFGVLDALALPATGGVGARVAVLLGDGHTVALLDAAGRSAELALAAPADRLLAGDVDGDGVPDLVAAADLDVTVLPGASDGTFGTRPPVEVPGYWRLLADLDGDGAADLVGGPGVRVALADRRGGFRPPAAFLAALDVDVDGAAALDLDGDRGEELLVPWGRYDRDAGYYRTFVKALRFSGDRLLELGDRERADHGALTLADLDGDGRPEVLAAGATIDVYRVASGGALEADGHYVPPDSIETPAVGDVNGDGLPDLVDLGRRSVVTVVRGRSGGRLGAIERLATGSAVAADVADVDGDGSPDVIAAAGRQLVVRSGADGGRFAPARTLALPAGALALERLGPVTGGGATLAVLLDDWSVVTAAPSPGGGYSVARVEPLPGGQEREGGTMTVADLDGDGLRDAAVVSNVLWKLWLLKGQPDGTLALARVLSQEDANTDLNGSWPTAIAAVDVDRDGRLDLVYSPLIGVSVVELLNQGDFRFWRDHFETVPAEVRSLLSFEADGDGRPELAVAYAGLGMDTPDRLYGVAILAGHEWGWLPEVARVGLRTAFDAYTLAAADFDGDGDHDLFAADPREGAMVFENQGQLRFAAPLDYATTGSGGRGRAGVGDVDGDGRLDVVLANGHGVDVLYGGCR